MTQPDYELGTERIITNFDSEPTGKETLTAAGWVQTHSIDEDGNWVPVGTAVGTVTTEIDPAIGIAEITVREWTPGSGKVWEAPATGLADLSDPVALAEFKRRAAEPRVYGDN